MPPAFQAFRPPCKDSLTTWKYSWFSLSILSCPHAGAAVISYLEHDVFEGFLVSHNGHSDPVRVSVVLPVKLLLPPPLSQAML